MNNNTREKLNNLRDLLRNAGVHGFILPVNDPYMSEYPPAYYQRLEWISGFSGSAGMAVILPEKAALFVDGRYTLQAAQQVDTECYEIYNSGDVSLGEWLHKNTDKGDVIAYDSWLHTKSSIERLEHDIDGKLELRAFPDNPIDQIWRDRPQFVAGEITIHSKKYSGRAKGEKREQIAQLIKDKPADGALIAAPDSICWLLDIRGGDVPHTPLVLAMALLHADGRCDLFMDEHLLADEVKAHLGNKVMIHNIAAIPDILAEFHGRKVMIDAAHTPVLCYEYVRDSGVEVINSADPCLLSKACKNAVELNGIRAAHIRDGAALSRFLCWLDGQVENGQVVTELQAEEKLLEFRRQDNLFHDTSFDTIAGSGANGAIVHYRATGESNRTLQKGELFLLDSGGQYPDGTTDVTRTVAIGEPSAEMRERFTLVLKGHIALATAIFPAGTRGSQLDVLARNHLWQEELDYDHGTGHGVGHYLNVHEGPQRISKRCNDVALREGMVISNEPGYYKAGEYGIRIENLVAVREVSKDKFLGFETLTCAPIDIRLIEESMLTAGEKEWLNGYHEWVKKSLSPFFDEDERKWLMRACERI